MTKIQVLSTCPLCQGQAYLPVGEAESHNGNKHIRHIPCSLCNGSGLSTKWVSLAEFITLLQQAQCPHQHTSFNGSFRFTAGDVWDDIHEVCDDCGTSMDRPILGDRFYDIP